MARSVVLRSTLRCQRCQLAPRWCICAALAPVESALQVDILLHHREAGRPSSTGHLIERVMPSARSHLFRYDRPLAPSDVSLPGKRLWILHPLGEPLAEVLASEASTGAPVAAGVQVLLLDASWAPSTRMLRTVQSWGRRINLPMTGESRFHLRAPGEAGRFSTIEALLFLMQALGLAHEHARLRCNFELHVYAGLRSRGRKPEAAAYLATSPVREELTKALAQFDWP